MYAVTPDSANRPLVLVIGSGHRCYREYLLQALAVHADIWLLQAAKPDWQQPYITGWTPLPSMAPDDIVRVARQVASERRVDGCVTWDEFSVIATALVCEKLNLPGFGVTAARACRDKVMTREALAVVGVPQPAFWPVTSLAEAEAVADELGWPLVVKPRRLGASLGVAIASSTDDLKRAFAQAAEIGEADILPSEDLIVEKALVGPEVSVDCAVINGEVNPLFCANKEIGFAPWCEEVGHTVNADDPLLDDPAFVQLLNQIHQALGVRFGITHTEVILTAKGPAVVEVNARWGGDLIPRLGMNATGIDVGAVTASVATGRPFNAQPTIHRAAAVAFRYPPESGWVIDIRTTSVPEVPGVMIEVKSLAEVGDLLRLPPEDHVAGRHGFLLATGPDTDTCIKAISACEDSLFVRVEPR